MIIRVTEDTLEEINLNPGDETEEITQNIAALAVTPRGSIPLERGMGLDMDYRDKPTDMADMLYESELTSAIDDYEPRVRVTDVTAEPGDDEGTLKATLEVEYADE